MQSNLIRSGLNNFCEILDGCDCFAQSEIAIVSEGWCFSVTFVVGALTVLLSWTHLMISLVTDCGVLALQLLLVTVSIRCTIRDNMTQIHSA